jgi:hypothetical protein
LSTTESVRTEQRFRAANEAVERHRLSVDGELLSFLCECSDLACTDDVELTRTEYATVRRGALRFAVVTGHEDGGERVLDEFDRYTVVEKTAKRFQ